MGAKALTSQNAVHKQPVLQGYDDAMITLSDQAIDWLVRLQSDDASDQDRVAFAKWRTLSDAHTKAANDAEALFFGVDETSSAREWSGVPEAPKSTPNAHRFRRRKLTAAHPVKLAGRRIAYLAASLCAVLALVIVGAIGNSDPWARWQADYATEVGAFETVSLPDGTIAHLNTASAFSIDYSGGVRRIELATGEVIFDVAKDPEHPFIVEAVGGEAMAVGTSYGVRIEDDHVKVTVQEGIVEVGTGTGNSIRLTAGEQGSYQAGHAPTLNNDVDLAAYGSWQRGKLIFNSQTLADVIKEVQRYKSEHIIIARDDLRDLKITGVFETSELDALLSSLAQTTTAKVVRLPLLTVIY